MGSQIIQIYYCDDCKEEVKNTELYNVNYSLFTDRAGTIGTITKEVCNKCFDYYRKIYNDFEDKSK